MTKKMGLRHSTVKQQTTPQPKLVKLSEEIDENDASIKYYIYRKIYVDTQNKIQETTIKVKYHTNTTPNTREIATTEIINEIKDNNYANVQSALQDYVKLLHEKHPDIKPYTYNAFSKRWAQK